MAEPGGGRPAGEGWVGRGRDGFVERRLGKRAGAAKSPAAGVVAAWRREP